MAIVVTTTQPDTFGFILNATSADLQGGEELKALVAGKSIKIRHLTINSDAAITVTIGEGQTGAAVTTALIGPVTFAVGQTMQWDFNPMMVLTSATNLSCDAGGAGNVTIFVTGVVE
jgi:hypothetical protein